MSRIVPKQQNSTSVWRYRAIALVGIVLLGGLGLKPTSLLNASVPEVLSEGEATKPQATTAARINQRQQQIRQIRPENYDLGRYPVTDGNEKHWRNILWTTAVVEPQEAFVAEALGGILAMMSMEGLSEAQMRTIDMATKTGTQLYLSNPNLYASVGQRFLQAVETSPDPEWVAVSLSGLAKAGMPPDSLRQLMERAKQRFPAWANNVFLYTTIQEIVESLNPTSTPPLGDLLNWEIAPKQFHLYVICQPDRYVLCNTVLKNRNGEFVRQSTGKLWSVPLLLRSLHNLSWNFVRGQTPQGIYRIEGTEPQPDDKFFRAYGQFSLVNMYMPFEQGVKQFLPGKPGPFKGSVAEYQKLLPPTWRSYWGIQQSYWAGKAGRTEFRIHGTGDSPDFFSGKSKNPESYSWNPTIGCLSALELYNEQGQLLAADMPKILKALETVGGKNFAGYVVVVEMPSKAGQPISVEEIEGAIASNKPKASPKVDFQKQLPPSQPQAAPAPNSDSNPEPNPAPSLQPLPLSY
jgi:hypothetical protein